MGRRGDPLTVILRSIRVVGDEFCWPATDILAVLDAFEQLNRVVLGAELWRFDHGPVPTVAGWTQYEVSDGQWTQRVVEARRKAAEELLGHAGDQTAWVHLTWEARGDDGD